MPSECGKCGGERAPNDGQLVLEYPSDEVADPGHVELELCEECAVAIATDVLVERAVTRDLDNLYDGVEDSDGRRASTAEAGLTSCGIASRETADRDQRATGILGGHQ